MSTPSAPSHRPQISPFALWFGIIGCIAVITFFYALMPSFGAERGQAPLDILKDSWNEETRYEHGIMFPFIILGLLIYQWKQFVANATLGDWKGLLFLLLGCFLYIIAYRVIQWRVAVGSLPFLVFGLVWYFAGNGVARRLSDFLPLAQHSPARYPTGHRTIAKHLHQARPRPLQFMLR